MKTATLISLFRKNAGRTLSLRAVIVGVNFVVMIGLAAVLGFDLLGQLVFLWGIALVAGTALSLGGPLLLLRKLTNGSGMRTRNIVTIVLIYPAAAGALGWCVLTVVWPAMPWAIILLTGFMANLLACLASLMRAVGSIQWSMTLRDAVPQVALGVGAIVSRGSDAAVILCVAAAVMTLAGALAILLCLKPGSLQPLLCDDRSPVIDLALWSTSLLGMAIAQMDLIVGGIAMPGEALGVYALLRRVANLVTLPVSVATWVSSEPISKAYGANDVTALQKASADGSRIAAIPGCAFVVLALTCLPAISFLVPDTVLPFGILVLAALVQVVLASGFTVATLCGLAHLAALARLASLVVYVAFALLLGPQLTLTSNAVLYGTAISFGSFLLWLWIKRRRGIDTSAFVLLGRREQAWKLS